MIVFLIILGIYIGMVMLSLLGPYVDFRKNYCVKGERYTLGDFYNKVDEFYWLMCFMPFVNSVTLVLSLVYLIIIPLWNKVKHIRIV